jgi:hypothetical protein
MVILTEQDKLNISNMPPKDVLYSEAPDGMSADDLLAWMMTGTDFERWKILVHEVMKEHAWTDTAIASVDWKVWKKYYFDELIEPKEAISIEMQGG